MKYKLVSIILFVSAIILIVSCKQDSLNQKITISQGDTIISVFLEKKSTSSFILHAETFVHTHKIKSSTFTLPYPIYHFETGDIDNNGIPDIAIGVIKPTYYDSVSRKRPFFFKISQGYIRPLWQGSRLAHPLENFRIKHTKTTNYLQSIEMERDGTFMVAKYVWNGFGFRFITYLCRNKNRNEAYKIYQE